MPPSSTPARPSHWLWPLLLAMGCFTALIAWLLVALSLGRQAGWMAVVVALESAWMLRLGNLPRGPLRIAVAMLATVLVIVAANWGIAAAQMGAGLGLNVWDSSLKMGAQYAWTLTMLANSPSDLLWLGIGVVTAYFSAR
ncbi:MULTISPECIES: hypothetical protein [Xanthomonas]|uniref:Uncharacterized protein n=1 Tax=Xanthomonas rydalmerensis TaxID=3046274 RepID=A0ABZ0JL14_9XANT|nr:MULTISPECIES: hypothetical protein [unclassified Xanthomonas]MBB5876913.1 hypothetical protein [Xanthomonas sp. 3498]MBB5941433.1 hypothetical protein [Xanthomonas sp. 3307]MXV07053.1 hypothetical protein [Xanthomonas sp. LMG 9002]WOS40078.1 hypothetical protein QN243_16995 [Xanthomonas sp. DM-2023]WOS44262.1 hypothetical protein QN242_16995 [Xanthomonas sp. DM-2023]